MKKNFHKIALTFSALTLGGLFAFFSYDKMSDDEFQILFNENYGIYALTHPKNIDFAGEAVPATDPEIYERLDRELLVNTYWQSNTMLNFKRAHQWFPVIEPILKKNGIPDDFKYLAVIESGLTNVVSPAGATGFWQIMESTGKGYGLEINKEVDERYHVEKSTKAACKYLNKAHRKFGNWTLAAASYNMGMAGVTRQMERQNGNSYYDMTLNSETGRYVFRILAVKEILENPDKFGFHFREKDLYQTIPTKTVTVDTSVADFGKFAEQMGINYRILKYHNPWLRYDYLPNSSGKKYVIDIPKKGHFQLSGEAGEVPEESVENLPEPISDTATKKE